MIINLQQVKKVLLFMLFIFQIYAVKAYNNKPPKCKHSVFGYFFEDCGCSKVSGSFGFGTLNNSNFIGVRYIYENFESKNGIFSNSPINKESFNTYQLWGQIPINDKFYVVANVPYQQLKRVYFDDSFIKANGLGDISVVGWYKYTFYKKKDKNVVDLSIKKEPSGHFLQFGLGVKLPTGKFEEYLSSNIANLGFQVGTGSVDGIFSVGYSYGGEKFGVNTLLSYYVKGENKNEYKFGNQFTYTTNFYSVIKKEKVSIMPFLGISGDMYNVIKQYQEAIKNTNGYIVNASLGSELIVKKFIFGANYTLPMSQNLFGGNVKMKQRFSVYVNFVL